MYLCSASPLPLYLSALNYLDRCALFCRLFGDVGEGGVRSQLEVEWWLISFSPFHQNIVNIPHRQRLSLSVLEGRWCFFFFQRSDRFYDDDIFEWVGGWEFGCVDRWYRREFYIDGVYPLTRRERWRNKRKNIKRIINRIDSQIWDDLCFLYAGWRIG